MNTSTSRPATTADLQVRLHRVFTDHRGSLVPLELANAVPFLIARLFWVFATPAGGTRGGHAHCQCVQYLICQRGAVEVTADDGEAQRTLVLEAGAGLLIPPAIWAEQRYLTPDTMLLVLCNRPYEAEDYIEAVADVKSFREQMRAEGPR